MSMLFWMAPDQRFRAVRVVRRSGVFRRRRDRREFERQALAAAEGVRPGVEAAMAEAYAALQLTSVELAATSGAAARCPHCGERMGLRRINERHKWWTLWRCPSCSRTYQPAEFADHTRAGGWA